MAQCKYLEGENIKPGNTKDAKALIGKKVKYLCSRDIDKSGRGYIFPRVGVIANVHNKEIAIDDTENYQFFISDVVEMVLLPEDDQ